MNSFGKLFKVEIFGESHGENLGVILDGVTPGISLEPKDFETDLKRRKSGKKGTTSRIEDDMPKIISGVFNGKTTGAPLTILFENQNQNSKDYSEIKNYPRPGHADFVAMKKFKGFNDYRGGGHFSGRLTLPIVAAGVVAKKMINSINITSKIVELGGKKENFESVLDDVLKNGDSVGGIVESVVKNVPIGLGEPFFDSLESLISHAVFSIPGVKGIEFGAGFKIAKMKGSEANDEYKNSNGKTISNNSGGINGGISNGNEIVFRVAFKPTSSIFLEMQTFDLKNGKLTKKFLKGRHDTAFVLRTPVIVESVVAFVFADLIKILEN